MTSLKEALRILEDAKMSMLLDDEHDQPQYLFLIHAKQHLARELESVLREPPKIMNPPSRWERAMKALGLK